MKQEYKDIQSFLDDVHNELSIYKVVVDEMGLLDKDSFKGSNFTNYIY